MTNFLFGAPQRRARNPSPATALRVQSSANGVPRPYGWGQARLSGNLLNYAGFEATAIQSSSSVGKGGGGGTETTGYSYSVSLALGLAEGPVEAIVQLWDGKSAFSVTAANESWSAFDGGYDQQPWPYLAALVPGQAQSYRGIAYAAVENLALGQSPDLPNLTAELRFAICDGLAETVTVPASAPYVVTAQYFDWEYGVAMHFTVPESAPYSVNGTALAAPNQMVAQSGVASAINTSDGFWLGTSSSGVIWDVGASHGTPGTPLTRVGSSPGAGQYSVGSDNSWTFNAADAGQPVVAIVAALAPAVFRVIEVSATITAGSLVLTNVSGIGAASYGARIVSGPGLVKGAFITSVGTGGSASGTVTSGSTSVGNLLGTAGISVGAPVSDSAGAIPSGTTVTSATPPAVTMSAAAGGSASGVELFAQVVVPGTVIGPEIILGAADSRIVVGASVVAADSDELLTQPGTVVTAVSGTTITISPESVFAGSVDEISFTSTLTADLAAGSASLSNVSTLAPLVPGVTVWDALGLIPYGTTMVSAAAGSLTLSAPATATVAQDRLQFGTAISLSAPATQSGSGVVTFRGAPMQQVLGTPAAAGEFSLSVQPGSFGQYEFSAADAGATVEIVDLPDANPADVLADFLTNPYYGLTQFDASRLGNLSVYRNYCQAAGLFVSPVVTSQAAANQFLQDLMSATNSELVWSGGSLTVVPYGDAALTANGASYTPPAAPLYALNDDDFLMSNQATNPRSSAAASSPDPVIVTRTDRAEQQNDVKLEYLDRANQYNPAIVEAKDDAAINAFGLKNSGSKQLHLFCNAKAAMAAAQLMLGRQSVLRSFAFTLDRKYILLDPMDIVAVTDANAGLLNQWVRITEITENDDRSLAIVAEEYLDGTGAAPLYGFARPAPFPALSRLGAAPNALAPMFLDAPVQVGKVMGMETILCTNGGGANWGGCDVWISSDNQDFRYAGTLFGGTVMGSLSAALPAGADPDVSDTLAVDLTVTQGTLSEGTSSDADQGHTLSIVDQELVAYSAATLTAAHKYNLGTYLRRGVYGTSRVSHAVGAPFARLRVGSYFTLGYQASDIGKTLYVKLLSFNLQGAAKQSLDQVTSYSHTLAAPALPAGGLLPGLIQAPDVAVGAATAQAIGSQPNHVTIPVSPSRATLVTTPLSTIGAVIQLAYNAQFINQSAASADTVTWYLTCDGTQIDTGTVTIAAQSAATIAKQTTYTPAAGAHSFVLQATDTSGIGFTIALLIDLSATEIRR